MFVNKHFAYITCAYLKNETCFDVNSSGTGQCPPDNCPQDNCPPDNCLPKIASPEIFPQIISPWTTGA